MDIVLIAGMWLDGSAWDDVMPELEALGHQPVALTLPGQGDGNAQATYDDQVNAILAAVDATAARRSWSVTPRPAPWPGWRPTRGRGRVAVAMVGGLPSGDGQKYVGTSRPSTGWCRSRGGSPSRAR